MDCARRRQESRPLQAVARDQHLLRRGLLHPSRARSADASSRGIFRARIPADLSDGSRCVASARALNRVGYLAETLDLHLDEIAIRYRRNTGWSAGRKNVSRLECHHVRDIRKQHWNREHHLTHAAALPLVTVHARDDCKSRKILGCGGNIADRTESVEALCARPLAILALKISSSHVIERNDSANCRDCFLFAGSCQTVTDHH